MLDNVITSTVEVWGVDLTGFSTPSFRPLTAQRETWAIRRREAFHRQCIATE